MSKITAIVKHPDISAYTFTKQKDFISKIIKVMSELGFKDEDEVKHIFGDYVNDEFILKDPTKTVDERVGLSNEEYNVVFVFGKERIFMIIFYRECRQNIISNIITKYFEVMKPTFQKI